MRVTTLFNRLLALPDALVEWVEFTGAGVVVGVRRRSRRRVCPCGAVARGRYDMSRRRWRHLDFGVWRVFVEADIARVVCGSCRRVRTEEVRWARPGARHCRDFEDVAAWLAQRMDKTSVSRLMRCAWETVDAICGRVVADHQAADSRLDGLSRIGVDEISYRRGHRYLTIVGDHDTGRVVWVAEGRTGQALQSFYEALGPDRRAGIQAVSMDMSGIYRTVTAGQLPHAAICFDPFHVVKWAGEALDTVHRATPTRGQPLQVDGVSSSRAWRKVRHTLRSAAENLDPTGLAVLDHLRRHQDRLFRSWQLKEELRDLYRAVDPADAPAHLDRWIEAAKTSGISTFNVLARRIERHRTGILNAIHRGLSNSRLEGINGRIRLIQRRGYGLRSVESLTTMIMLCLGKITIKLPTQT